jgi:NAD-dependent SIR2 family protein deacetylase
MAAATPEPAVLPPETQQGIVALARLLAERPGVVVLSGAGCSTDSGIPDYRDSTGRWKPGPPVLHQDFLRHAEARQRYWARSMAGWPRFQAARPNTAHGALATLQQSGFISHLITQNVDGLHQRAGSHAVTELHGSLDRVGCLDCGSVTPRAEVQQIMRHENPGYCAIAAPLRPDGDAHLEPEQIESFKVPQCPACAGTLKPDVVFFGDSVPRERVEQCSRAVASATALVCVGTSLMVFSGYRFCRQAAAQGIALVSINLGRTRADELFNLKIEAPCADALDALLPQLGCPAPQPEVPKALHRSDPPISKSTMT